MFDFVPLARAGWEVADGDGEVRLVGEPLEFPFPEAQTPAVALDRRLKRGLKIEVTLISCSNFFLFTPLLAEVAASLVEARHAVSPIRRMLDRVRFIEGTVQTANPVRRTVAFVDQNGHARLLSYQHCLLASGSVTEFLGIPGLAENALTLK